MNWTMCFDKAWPLAHSVTPRKRFSKTAASEARKPESKACRAPATTPPTPGAFIAFMSYRASRGISGEKGGMSSASSVVKWAR
eukprot:7815360-Pyramimonas_sp.AAC.1